MKANKRSEIEDVTLMKELALGDSSALDKLYRKHCNVIEAFVRGKLGLSDSDVEPLEADAGVRQPGAPIGGGE